MSIVQTFCVINNLYLNKFIKLTFDCNMLILIEFLQFWHPLKVHNKFHPLLGGLFHKTFGAT